MKTWLGVAACLVVAVASSARAADWPQFNVDSRHSGANYAEATITRANVATLHLRYPPVALPGIADGAPVFLGAAETASGPRNLLFVTTKDGTLVALDADAGEIVWTRQPDAGPRYTTSSPALDPGRAFVYSYGLDGKVHKYQVADGTEVVSGGWPGLATRKPDVEKGSSALTVATVAGTPFLYVTNGGYPGDAGDYQGHVTAIDLATGAQRVFNANCSNQPCHFAEHGSGDCGRVSADCPAVQTAIWARAGVVYDEVLNRLFAATGNGTFDAASGGNDWGDSVLAINPDGTGGARGWPLDSYTPEEFKSLQDTDRDLGSTAPAIVVAPAGSNVARVGVQSGKDGSVRLLNLADLSGAGGAGHVGGELQKFPVPQRGEVLTALAVWVNPEDGASWVYVANGNGISGFKLGVSGGRPALATSAPDAWTESLGGTSPIVAGGVLFYAASDGVRALDPTSGALLWRDTAPGPFHWESPIVVDGRLYVTDEEARLHVYEPGPEPRPVRRRLRRAAD